MIGLTLSVSCGRRGRNLQALHTPLIYQENSNPYQRSSSREFSCALFLILYFWVYLKPKPYYISIPYLPTFPLQAVRA